MARTAVTVEVLSRTGAATGAGTDADPTNDDVVEFVNNLRRTDQFGAIKLMESRAGLDNKMNTYQFRLDLAMKG